jgi:hypothetical protein
VDKSSIAIRQTIFEIALIDGTILPVFCAFSVLIAVFPLPDVNLAGFGFVRAKDGVGVDVFEIWITVVRAIIKTP